MDQISLDTLNAADRKTFMAAISEVMELAPWVAEETFAKRPFGGIAALYQAMTDAVRNAPPERRQPLINGHHDLAGKAAREGGLTADSTAEQAAAGLDKLSEQELADFHRLNDAYREKFAMPFVVCVRRHGKQSILREFARRLNNDAAAEQRTALEEIFRIAALRLTSALSPMTDSKSTGIFRRTCSTRMPVIRRKAWRSNCARSRARARRASSSARRPTPRAAPTRRCLPACLFRSRSLNCFS